jgi:ankyrin repeat protein
LLESHADPNIKDNHGRTPLMLAGPESALLLSKHGADSSIKDKDGNTAKVYTTMRHNVGLLMSEDGEISSIDLPH